MSKKRNTVNMASLFLDDKASDEKPVTKKPVLPVLDSLTRKEDQKVIHHQRLDLEIDPAVIRPWRLHDRDQTKLNENDCADIIESIRAIGQKDPIKVRKLENDPDGFLYEIIKGRRRTYACSVLGYKVLARGEDMSDVDAWLEMDSENDDREDISEMERAKSYAAALEAELFSTASELAARRGKPKSHVSKYLAAEFVLHNVAVMALISDPLSMPVTSAAKLGSLLKSSSTKATVEKRAYNLKAAGKKMAAAAVINDLIKSVNNTKAEAPKAANEYQALIGDKLAIAAKKEKGSKITMSLDTEDLTAAELFKSFKETLKNLGVK
jgi:ParB family chromosome partitioning protein